MRDDDAPLVLSRLKQHYLVDYAALPWNPYHAESNVKDANFCQVKGRDDNLLSSKCSCHLPGIGSEACVERATGEESHAMVECIRMACEYHTYLSAQSANSAKRTRRSGSP
jgi:hypothetical protein